jgi:hypothetical protein
MTLYQYGVERLRGRYELRRFVAPDPLQESNPSSL